MFLQLIKTHSDSKCLCENALLAYQNRAGFPQVTKPLRAFGDDVLSLFLKESK